MQQFTIDHFLRTGNETYLGNEYGNYWLVELLHKQSKRSIDVIIGPSGDTITTPDAITDRIRNNYCINGNHAKIVPITINNEVALILKWPPL